MRETKNQSPDEVFALIEALPQIEGPPLSKEELEAVRGMKRLTRIGVVSYALLFVLLTTGLTLHLLLNTWMVAPHGSFNFFTAFFAYGAIAWGLGALLVLLLYGIFTAGPGRPQGVRLREEDAPGLFRFVTLLTTKVGVSCPFQIRITQDVNAYVRPMRQGIKGFLSRERGFVLGLGLPLLHGASLSALADTVAHEVGHWATWDRFNRSRLAWAVFSWMGATFRRGRFLKRLHFVSYFFILSGVLFEGGLLLLKWTLAPFYEKWIAANTRLIRISEFEADSYSANLVGGEGVAETFSLMKDLEHIGELLPAVVLSHYFRTGRVPSDLGRLMARILTEESLKQETDDAARRPCLFPPEKYLTHPADNARITRAHGISRRGLLSLEGSAAVLLGDGVDERAKKLAQRFYEKSLRLDILPEAYARGDLDSEIVTELGLFRALRRFFMGPLGISHGGRVDRMEKDERDLGQLNKELSALREHLRFRFPGHRDRLSGYDQLEERLVDLEMMKINYDFSRFLRSGRFETEEEEDFESKRAALRREVEELETRGRPYERKLFHRANVLTAILRHPQMAPVLPQEDLVARLDQLFPALEALEGASGDLVQLRREYQVFARICAVLPGNEGNGPLSRAFMERYTKVRALMESLSGRLSRHKVPLKGEARTFARWTGGGLPPERAYEATIKASHAFLQGLVLIRERLYAEYAHILEQVEAALGLEPLYDGGDFIPVPHLFATVPQLLERRPERFGEVKAKPEGEGRRPS